MSKEAQAALQKQAEHQKMEEWYKKNPLMNKTGLSFHCERIAVKYQEMAKEYEDLAKMHRALAKTPS